ncbi:MAG: hypothetical protein O2812_03090 [Chloroflexi bacterium]|nr:hypothetical protein [Chloroflexota bacterium]
MFVILMIASALLIEFRGFTYIPDNFDGRRDGIYYLLSAQAQVLGAIVALVSTLSLVAAQLITRYSHRAFSIVHGGWVFWYLGLYLLGIAVALFLLMGNFLLPGIQFSFALAIVCLFALAPYLLVLRQHMDIGYVIDVFQSNANRRYEVRLATGQPESLPEAVQILNNFAMGAFSAHDYDSFELAVAVITAGTNQLVESEQSPEMRHQLLMQLIERLERLTIQVINERAAPRLIIRQIGQICQAAARHSLHGTISKASEALKEIATYAARYEAEEVVSDTVHLRRSIGKSVIDNWTENSTPIIGLTAWGIRIAAVDGLRYGLGEPASHAVIELGRLGIACADDDKEGAVREVANELIRLTNEGVTQSSVEKLPTPEFAYRQVKRSGALALGKLGHRMILQQMEVTDVDRISSELIKMQALARIDGHTDVVAGIDQALGEIDSARQQMEKQKE